MNHRWLAVLLVLMGIADAGAHAVLLTTEPADGATLQQAPTEVVLEFSEPVAPVFVRLIAAQGQAPADADTLTTAGPELRLALPPDLPRGAYLVSFRVISADSHPVGGSFGFAVGAGQGAAAPAADAAAGEDTAWTAARVLLALVRDLGLMLAAGGVLFWALVLRGTPPPAGFRALALGSGIVAMAAALAGIGAQGGLLRLGGAAALLDPATWRLGASTSVGPAAGAMIAALALALAGTGSDRPLGRWVGGLAAVAATASLSLSGHSAGLGGAAPLLLAVHGSAVAFWLGALWPLHRVLQTRSPAEALTIVRRFSAIAVPAVGLLVAAGLTLAVQQIPSLSDLAGSAYGGILLLKLALVALLLALAVVNRQRLTPALAATPGPAAQTLTRNIRREMALAGLILAVTAVLAHTPPPRPAAGHQDHAAAHGPAVAVQRVVAERRAQRLILELRPGRVGENTLTVRLSDAAGRPLDPLELGLAFSLPAAGIEPLQRTPRRTSEGRYVLESLHLPLPGRWQVRAEALINDFEKTVFVTEMELSR